MTRAWHLAKTNYGDVRNQPPIEVAVLPFGATEPHNLHLPYGTDTYQVDAVADRACDAAHATGCPCGSVARPFPTGPRPTSRRFPMAMNLNPTTMAAVVGDLVDSLEVTAFGNAFCLTATAATTSSGCLRQLHGKTTVQLFLCNWYKIAADQYPDLFEDAGDHAGEMETSMILAHFAGTCPDGTGRRRHDGDDKAGGGQSRLGRDHPSLAPA